MEDLSRGDFRRRGDPALEEIEVDIAAGEHEPDLSPGKARALLHRRCEGGCAGALGEIVRIRPKNADRVSDLLRP